MNGPRQEASYCKQPPPPPRTKGIILLCRESCLELPKTTQPGLDEPQGLDGPHMFSLSLLIVQNNIVPEAAYSERSKREIGVFWEIQRRS